MFRKKGVELAVNVIVIITLALLILALMAFLVTGAFSKIMESLKSFPKLEIPPDKDNPISFVPLSIERGKTNKMTIGFYNNENSDISKAIIPKIYCQGISYVAVQATGIVIPVGQSNTYSVLVSVPKTVIAKSYPCTMTISKTEKTFFMDVK